jgi:hypothetical protein
MTLLNKFTWFTSVGLGIVIFFSLTMSSNAEVNNKQTGTIDDPLVTKSYVDLQINNMKQEIISQLNNNEVALNFPQTNEYEISTIQIIRLEPSQTLYAGAGTEFIVRTGKTIAVSNDEDGIPDVTAGKDIPAGSAISNNHLLVFPKDTRGIKPDPKNTGDIYVMVRGTYLLMNADGTKAEIPSP